MDKRISLNLSSKKCVTGTGPESDAARAFNIEMNAIPYSPYEFPHNEICHSCSDNRVDDDVDVEDVDAPGMV